GSGNRCDLRDHLLPVLGIPQIKPKHFSEKSLRLQMSHVCRILWGGIPKKEDCALIRYVMAA
ncbi:MAG: hypothetical protein IJB61_09565, partial [Bacteroides sp]|nr:hypothetical protein [Bacteroides sp.]